MDELEKSKSDLKTELAKTKTALEKADIRPIAERGELKNYGARIID